MLAAPAACSSSLPPSRHGTLPANLPACLPCPPACSCDGEDKAQTVTLFAQGTLLGRDKCPWPMILAGQDGYNSLFDFDDKVMQRRDGES